MEVNALNTFSSVALLAIAIWFALSCGRLIVGATSFALIAAFVMTVAVRAGAPAVVGAVEGIVVATLLGATLALATARATAAHFAIATLLLWVVATRFYQAEPRVGPPDLYVTALAIVAFAAVAYAWSRWGLAAAALALDERAAQEAAIDPLRSRFIAVTAASSIAGLAGVLSVSQLPPPWFGFDANITALAAVVIGGVRTPIGPLVGALLLTWLTREPALHSYAHVIVPALLLVATIALPGGIASVFASALSWVARR